MGPFKYELKHANPEIGLFHDLVRFLGLEVPLGLMAMSEPWFLVVGSNQMTDKKGI